MTAAQITATVRNLPVSTSLPGTLTRGQCTAQDFLRWPSRRDDFPKLSIIQHAVETGRNG
ncbi:hypothetical protein D3Y57_19105 [Sphingomonas paeninsulae]|uniref:Uncharacterized protein n=1 Tax=Sphingomonas paeninsulae TaxID=2319844 RepID=A0A494TPA1_SPHPE|nr:hypothetical protein [Sphingomonas paeninsulae]AYJ87646.1 hypothetical protein D3Y57_19105 [Sphingomonas paeninsulae]